PRSTSSTPRTTSWRGTPSSGWAARATCTGPWPTCAARQPIGLPDRRSGWMVVDRPTDPAKGEDSHMSYMPIEWGKIREYAVATGSSDPDYLENPNAPIPPTFLSTVVFWDQPGRAMQSPEAIAALAEIDAGQGTDIRNVLSVEQEYRFHGP